MILVDNKTRVIVQGITGKEASFHTRKCIEYGTKVVAGVTPGKGGVMWEGEVPVYNSVAQAKQDTEANASLIFVPALFAFDAIVESASAGISLVVCITEFIPALVELYLHHILRDTGTTLIGPNCPGVISPGATCKLGIMPGYIHKPGNIGVVSRSGTLTYEVVSQLTEQGLGQSTCVGLGGDPLPGSNFVDILKLFQKDPETKAVVLIGEIGGSSEQEAAEFIRKKMTKPVISYITGISAPPGKRMGHAGAIIGGSASKASTKIESLAAAGATVVADFGQIGLTCKDVLKSRN